MDVSIKELVFIIITSLFFGIVISASYFARFYDSQKIECNNNFLIYDEIEIDL